MLLTKGATAYLLKNISMSTARTNQNGQMPRDGIYMSVCINTNINAHQYVHNHTHTSPTHKFMRGVREGGGNERERGREKE